MGEPQQLQPFKHLRINTSSYTSLTPPLLASYGVQQRSRVGRSGPTWYAGEFKGGKRSGTGIGLWLSEYGFLQGLYEGEWLKVQSFLSRGLISLMRTPLFSRFAGQASRQRLAPI
jgi:hypothetical protein